MSPEGLATVEPRVMGATTDDSDLADLAPGSVATVFGTRPEIIKLSGIIEMLGDKARTIFSGQHFDRLLSDIFFDELGLPPPDVMLAVGGRSRAQQVGELVLRLRSYSWRGDLRS